MNKAKRWCATFALLLGAGACTGSTPNGNGNGDGNGNGGGDTVDAGVVEPDAEVDPYDEALAERETDYPVALRIASLRLTGQLPTLAALDELTSSADQKTTYETMISGLLADPRFADQQVEFWQNTFKMGGSQELDSGGVFAAQLAVEGRSYLELLTATAGTCPTYDENNRSFTAQDCNNNVATHAGLLTHPGMNAHFTSNMAFRRVAWVQETFACTAFPAEVAAETQELSPTAVYTAPWEFESISGLGEGPIDFQDYSSVVCANCHASMNHIAPLFGYFDENGQLQNDIAVITPVEGNPNTLLTDWLPAGQQTAWRFGQPAADLPALGAAMAADPAIADCAVARAWNWAMGKGDIVDTLTVVPPEVFATQRDAFVSNNYNFKSLLFDVFTSEDFTKF